MTFEQLSWVIYGSLLIQWVMFWMIVATGYHSMRTREMVRRLDLILCDELHRRKPRP